MRWLVAMPVVLVDLLISVELCKNVRSAIWWQQHSAALTCFLLPFPAALSATDPAIAAFAYAEGQGSTEAVASDKTTTRITYILFMRQNYS
jgi:hypothetical protein